MTARTLPTQTLIEGMARCVRETILPALEDPSAQTQAEVLAALLDGLPAAISAETNDAVRADSDAARTLLTELGGSAPRPPAPQAVLGELLAENHALHGALLGLATRARADGDGERLRSLQQYFLASARTEHAPTEQATDFASLSSQEDSARRGD
ncbi:MAG: hypothetical protein P8R42_02530 [Candidatus Binatia bacterium]|nr:hypothetical protein [Candidatus Binatia bacterium]